MTQLNILMILVDIGYIVVFVGIYIYFRNLNLRSKELNGYFIPKDQ